MKELLDIDNIYLKQSVDSISFRVFNNSADEELKKELEPFQINYLALSAQAKDQSLFKQSIYFNIDSLNTLTSIVVELFDAQKVAAQITQKYGDPYRKSEFNFSSSSNNSKTWQIDETCVYLFSSLAKSLVVIYKCNDKSFLKFSKEILDILEHRD